ncbi:hypothetical protein [Actinomadura geliboluensis]|uniref:hypothetical protein n=1 Tax=Actinomadura geliboluensis TaxID=882440 RepID=UPI0036885F97
MAMTRREAQAVMQLVRFTLGDWSGPAWRVPSPEKAREATIWLTGRAHDVLRAGLTAADVEDRWPDAPPHADEAEPIGLVAAVADILGAVADGETTPADGIALLRERFAVIADQDDEDDQDDQDDQDDEDDDV